MDRRIADCRDVVVVGAGFAGLYALYKLREEGFDAVVLEAGSDVGGTWFWNKYPGARCDVESVVYAYTFDPDITANWQWTERFAKQEEILAYLRYVSDKLDLLPDIVFGARVRSATFDDEVSVWTVESTDGRKWTAKNVIMATGALSAPKLPDIPGVETFAGRSLFTSSWSGDRSEIDCKRVGIIGTGSSAIQAIPIIAQTAAELVVFQRTAAFVAPARNAPLTQSQFDTFVANSEAIRQKGKIGEIIGPGDALLTDEQRAALAQGQKLPLDQRADVYELCWNIGGGLILANFPGHLTDIEENQSIADFVKSKIYKAVDDPDVARRLVPTGYPIGSKRLCIGSDYYETFNRRNVRLVDARDEPILKVTEQGVQTPSGIHQLDVIIFATGFDALTGALLAIDITGANGMRLRDRWAEGTSSFLGIAIAGFPNLFTITGPGSPSVLSNVVVSIEFHVEWIVELLRYVRSNGFKRVEANMRSEIEWTDHVDESARDTLFMKGKSWYTGANIPGKPNRFLAYVGGLSKYRNICEDVRTASYSGFRFDDLLSCPN